MRYILLIVLFMLGGCYTVNQEKFAKYAEAQVRVGMPIPDAIGHLSSDGFDCDDKAARLIISCTRIRQSLMPYSCIERINIMQSGGTVSSVQIHPIVCAGF